MLSGFVLTLAYEDRLHEKSAARFLAIRVARLWPVLAIGVLIAGAGHLVTRPEASSFVLLATLFGLLFIPLLAESGGIYVLNGPQWSLTFELLANFVHAALLRHLSDRKVLLLALVCGCGLAVLTQIFDGAKLGDIGANWWAGFFRVGYGYSLGVWMGRRFRAQNPIDLGRWWFAALVPLPVILILIGRVPLTQANGDCLAIFVLLPQILSLAARICVPMAAQSPLDALGRLSYPLYAIHVPVLAIGGMAAIGQPATAQTSIRIMSLAAVLWIGWALARSPFAKGLELPAQPSFPSQVPFRE